MEPDIEDLRAANAPVTRGSSSLAGLVRRGAAISAGSMFAVQAVSLVSTLVLARLLSPEEVGIFAAGSVLTVFLNTFTEGGLRGALIQRRGSVDDASDTVFWATAATGVLMCLSALAASPVVGMVFGTAEVTQVAAATSCLLLLEALTTVPDGLMQRRFDFRRRSIIDPAKALVYAVVAITLASTGYGIWALVIGQYAGVVVWLVGSWWLARWRPGHGRPSVRLWREMARFAYPLVVQDVVLYVRELAQSVLVARRLGERALGQYRYGTRLGLLPGLAVIEIGAYVLFPAFSQLAGDAERFTDAFLRALRWIWLGNMLVAALIVAIGEPMVVVLLGEPWREAGLFLVAAAGYGLGVALQAVGAEAIKASGRSGLLHWVSALELLLGVGLVVAFLPLGLTGVGLALSGCQLAAGAVLVLLAHRVVDFSLAGLVAVLRGPALAGVVAVAVVAPLEHILVDSDSHGTVAGLALLALETILASLLYVAVLWITDRDVIEGGCATARALVRRRPTVPGRNSGMRGKG